MPVQKKQVLLLQKYLLVIEYIKELYIRDESLFFYIMKKKPLRLFNFTVASPEGFEPSTARLEGVCSIQLSYGDNCFNNVIGIKDNFYYMGVL